jgi:hypothetical protein
MNLANVGGSMTGGSTVVLTPAGLSANGKASYTTPSHTRLAPRTVDFLVTPTKISGVDPGTARSALRVYFADRTVAEGCCDTKVGSVIIEVSCKWSLNQPESLVDSAIDYLQSLVFDPAFVAGLKSGTLPTS